MVPWARLNSKHGFEQNINHHYWSQHFADDSIWYQTGFFSFRKSFIGVFRNFLNILQSHWKAVSSKKRIVAQKSRIVAQKTRIVAVKGRWPAGRRWLPILRSMRLRVAVVVSCWTMRKEVAEMDFSSLATQQSVYATTMALKKENYRVDHTLDSLINV